MVMADYHCEAGNRAHTGRPADYQLGCDCGLTVSPTGDSPVRTGTQKRCLRGIPCKLIVKPNSHGYPTLTGSTLTNSKTTPNTIETTAHVLR